MLRQYQIISVLLLGLASSTALAAPDAKMKMAVIETRVLVAQSAQGKAAQERLLSEFKPREAKIVEQDKIWKEKSEKLQRNAAVMSDVERVKLEKEVHALHRELQRLQADYREDIAARQQEEVKKIMEKINTVVQDIAQKEKYDLIMDSEVASYASKQVNITDKVMKLLNEKA